MFLFCLYFPACVGIFLVGIDKKIYHIKSCQKKEGKVLLCV